MKSTNSVYSFASFASGFYNFFLYAPIASLQSAGVLKGEFYSHSTLIVKLQEAGAPFYSIWYNLQYLLIGPNDDKYALIYAGMLIVGIVSTLKGMATFALLAKRYSVRNAFIGSCLLGSAISFPPLFYERTSQFLTAFNQSHNLHTSNAISLYLGTIPPNAFMSATQLVSNFSSLAAFGLAFLFVSKNKKITYFNIFGLYLIFLICVLAKPSNIILYMTCFIPTCLYKSFKDKSISISKLSLLLTVLSIYPVAHTLKINQFFSSGKWLDTHTVWSPLVTWHYFSGQIVLDLISSIAFPLLVSVFIYRFNSKGEVIANLIFWLPFIFSTAIFICLAESYADRLAFPGNYIWSAISANSGLYLISLMSCSKIPKPWASLCVLVLLIQSIYGLYYLNIYLHTGNFI